MITILGAGLAGLSSSYHIGHDKCIIFEKNNYATGHIHSEFIDGFTWDEGPHVSFTQIEYVKRLFEESVKGSLLEYPVKTTNYYKGNWIPHPAQCNLFAVPHPIGRECLDDFLKARSFYPEDFKPQNYREWLDCSLGTTFTSYFPAAYTRKYWTTDPKNLTIDWVGNRVFYPKIEQVKEGFYAPLAEETHYIKKVRYPQTGGYMSFAGKLMKDANLEFNHVFTYIDFEARKIEFSNGKHVFFDKLISTIPLPVLISKSNAPEHVKSAALNLNCSSVLLVNVAADHATVRPDNWIYIYDEDKYSTRINCTELLSPNNAPTGKTGIQVEVYFSNYKPKIATDKEIADQVLDELLEMGLIESKDSIESCHTKWVQWANVIFDHQRRENQEVILDWLTKYGLSREADDLEPMTDWNVKPNDNVGFRGDIILAGRFGQWKYYWTDDCVMRGLTIANDLKNKI